MVGEWQQRQQQITVAPKEPRRKCAPMLLLAVVVHHVCLRLLPDNDVSPNADDWKHEINAKVAGSFPATRNETNDKNTSNDDADDGVDDKGDAHEWFSGKIMSCGPAHRLQMMQCIDCDK